MYQWRIGPHVRSMDDVYNFSAIDGINLIELKPDKLYKRSRVRLYDFDGSQFHINHKTAKEIGDVCADRGVTIHMHLPLERTHDSATEEGLCQADRGHHDLILARYDMIGELLKEYGIGQVITVHPPAFSFGENKLCNEGPAILAGEELLKRADALIKEKDYGFRIGLENVADPKPSGTSQLGYIAQHIDKLIGTTSRVGITLDSGHRQLADGMSVRRLVGNGHIEEIHFHSNPGIRVKASYDDDAHSFATPDNLPDYDRWILSIRRNGTPVVLEISEIDIDALGNYVANLRRELGNP